MLHTRNVIIAFLLYRHSPLSPEDRAPADPQSLGDLAHGQPFFPQALDLSRPALSLRLALDALVHRVMDAVRLRALLAARMQPAALVLIGALGVVGMALVRHLATIPHGHFRALARS